MTASRSRIDSIWSLLGSRANPADLERAEVEALAFASDAPDHPEAALLAGCSLAATGKYTKAIAWLERAHKDVRSSLLFASAYAMSLTRVDRLDDAMRVFMQAPPAWRNPTAPPIPEGAWNFVSLQGECALRAGDFALVEALYLKIYDSIHATRRSRAAVPPVPGRGEASRRVLPLIYLPIEVKSRELDSRLLIAAHAARHGLSSLVGATWNLRHRHFTDLPPGIVLAKTFGRFDMVANRKAAAAGHLIAGIDEEALGRADSEPVTLMSVWREAVRGADLILAQGERQRILWSRLVPDAADRITVTGNPRADLARLNRSGAAKDGHVLVCLMNGTTNGRDRTFANTVSESFEIAGCDLATPEGDVVAGALRDYIRFELGHLRAMPVVIAALARTLPQRTIIVRPHPVENADHWRRATAGLANVQVMNEGPLTDSLKSAAAVVFISGCTTGVEAELAGVPTVRFVGDPTVMDPEVGFSSRLGLPAREPEEIAERVADILAGKITPVSSQATIDEYLSNESATVAIAGSLARLHRAHAAPDPVDPDAFADFNARRAKRFVPSPFHLGKFPPTTVQDIIGRYDALRQISGLSETPRIRQVEWNTFLISSSATSATS